MTNRDNSIIIQTEWQAITKRFPFSTFDADRKPWRVLFFDGDTIPHDNLQKTIAAIISRILARQYSKSNYATSKNTTSQIKQDSLEILKEIAAEWGLNEPSNNEAENDTENSMKLVLPDQIKLISPREAKVSLYPRSLKCNRCNYYMIATDLRKLHSLNCPNCNNGILQPISLLFFCDECGYQHELAPRFKDPQKDGPIFKCEDDGCSGNLFLRLDHRRLTRSRWICSKTGKETPVIYFCPFCSDWSNKDPKRMTIKPTTASYLKAMLYSAVYVNDDKEISISEIEPIWKLMKDINYTDEEKDTIKEYGIDDLWIIDNVISYTAVYGYAPYGDDVQVRFFRKRNLDNNQYEYRAYMTQSQGKGMIIKLDKKRVTKLVLEEMIQKLQSASNCGRMIETVRKKIKLLDSGEVGAIDSAYSWISKFTKDQITDLPIGELKDRVPLFTLLHSLEHALTYQASLRTGLQESSFIGKVLIDDCAILIFERSQVEAGGIEYLAHDLLLKWLNEAWKQVRDCRYQCEEGCVTCLFIRDQLCHPFSPNEVPGAYIFPNSLLSRKLLLSFWNVPISTCNPENENAMN